MPSVVLKEAVIRIACSHCSTTEFRVSCSCSDTDAVSPNLVQESGSCRIAWVVVLPVLADQDAFGSSLPALCERSSGL